MSSFEAGLLPAPPTNRTGWPWIAEDSQSIGAGSAESKWPKISIITPSFNQVTFLEKTIRSVLLQGYPNLEFMILDGGSTDGSVDIIQKYAKRITHWRSRKDEGQSAAINEGMQRATGKILAWLNSDDCYLPGTLFRVARTVSSDRAMVVGAALIANEFATETEHVFKQPSFQEMLFEGHLVPQPSTFWTAELWKIAGPLKKNFHYVMDYDLWIRMFAAAEEVRFCPEPLSLIQNHGEQKTQVRNYNKIQVEKFLVVMENLRYLGMSAATYTWRKWLHVRTKRSGIYRLLPVPRRSELAALIYPISPAAAIHLVSGA
ncbi:MAG TPA: glycosyltransferase family 2 protein [Candidatus Binatia bacterium]|jgi:glycosyltransferase involved in cell wall biosynthesis|nr:glycosyltransferase family 2 protein [Candidatus Binatia bacterium]